MKEKRIANAREINKMRCILALIICSIVIGLTVFSLTLNITNFFDEGGGEVGFGTLKMYTTLSNIIAMFAASICIPFQIEGLIKNKYRLPKWVVKVLYIGAAGVTLTFFVAITLISATNGFVYAMFTRSNLFMHTLTPIFIIILFTMAIPDAHIKFSFSFFTLIPTIIYALIYFICVFATQVWRDHYQLKNLLPWPITLIIVISLAFGLSNLIRFLHNLTNKHVVKSIERYYKESPDYEFPNITAAIAKLAEVESKYFREGDEIYIPVDIIKMLSDRYNTSSLPLDIQYDIYLENYLRNIHPTSDKK